MISSGETDFAVRLNPLVGSHSGANDALREVLGSIPPAAGWDIAQVLRAMQGYVPIGELARESAGSDPQRLFALHLLLQMLARYNLVEFASAPQEPILTLVPIAPGFALEQPIVRDADMYRLSRFAYLHRAEDGQLTLETPRGLARAIIHDALGLSLLLELAKGASIADLMRPGDAGWAKRGVELRAVFGLLEIARAIERCGSSEVIPEDEDDMLRQWEFHDLLFHARSRLGRHDYPMGGLFRFQGQIEPQPALKSNRWRSAGLPLPRPDMRKLGSEDAPFSAVLEARRSVREQGAAPISLEQLGEFLYRVARVRGATNTAIGEFTNRPYPNGGASYELEFYLTIDRCAGLEPGFYYYDPAEHLLCPVSGPNDDTALMLMDAYRSNAETCWPQVLITLASRFQRVSWKYSGIAYATQLKNVGALYSVMYLVATAMGLAPCALGLGNSERFCRLAGTSPFEEGSIGEFMLGSSLSPPFM